MTKVLQYWNYFAINIAPWLVVAGIPSLITALTKYPQAGGVVKALQTILDLLSALTHKDSPGTLKLPLSVSTPPMIEQDAAAPARSTQPHGRVDVSLLLALSGFLIALGIALVMSGCAGGAAFGKCELGKLPQTLQSIIAAVAAIAAEPGGYVQDLERLGTQIGPAQLDCIVSALIADTSAPKGYRRQKEPEPWVATLRSHLQEYLNHRRAKGAKLECNGFRVAVR